MKSTMMGTVVVMLICGMVNAEEPTNGVVRAEDLAVQFDTTSAERHRAPLLRRLPAVLEQFEITETPVWAEQMLREGCAGKRLEPVSAAVKSATALRVVGMTDALIETYRGAQDKFHGYAWGVRVDVITAMGAFGTDKALDFVEAELMDDVTRPSSEEVRAAIDVLADAGQRSMPVLEAFQDSIAARMERLRGRMETVTDADTLHILGHFLWMYQRTDDYARAAMERIK